MATLKQQKVVTKLVENSRNSKPKNKGEILAEVGYSKATAIKPSQVLESKGVKEELEPILKEMIEHRKNVLKQMKKKVSKAQYNQLSDAFDKMTKNIQLLSGGSTENVLQVTWEK